MGLRRFFSITLFLVLILSGCLSVPEPENNDSTLLVIDRVMSKSSHATPIYQYQMIFEDEELVVDSFLPANNLLFIEGLPAGEYQLVAIHEIKPVSDEIINEFPLSTSVILKAGYYTILDFKISARLVRGYTSSLSSYKDWQYTEIISLDSVRREEIVNVISSSKNGYHWSY